MKGLKVKGLGLVAAAAVAAIGAGLLVSSVLAVSGTVGIGSASAAPGDSATVDLTANVGSPGLGAWTVDITYDPTVVSVNSCTGGATNSVCNPAYTADSIRVTGASAMGVMGDAVLSAITFDCADAEGTSALTLAVSVFADATPGAPADVTYTASNGSIDCEVPEPTATEAEEPEPTALPPTGMGSDGSGGGLSWLIAVLAGAGAATVAGFGALRLRSRRV